MLRFYAAYLWVLSILVVVMVVRDHARRKVDLMSWRNFFLLGLILFQFHSGARSFWGNAWGQFPVNDPVGSGLIFVVMCTVFCLVFLFTYRQGWLADWSARKTPVIRTEHSDASLFYVAVISCVLAYVFRLGVTQIPSLRAIANVMGLGFAGVSAATVGWVWIKQLGNPVQLIASMVVVAANLIIVLYSSFGRRTLLAVGLAAVWGLYYSYLRSKPTSHMFTRLLPTLLIPLLLVALFTSVRDHSFHTATPTQIISAMAQRGSIKAGFSDLGAGQATGAAAVWTIEKWPEEFETRHLFTLRYALVMYVPRSIWPDKPYPLSTYAADYAGFEGVKLGRDGVTIPVGIIGYAAAEGGWYALVIYAMFLAMVCRYGDSLTKLHPVSPFILLPLGCQLGQILGLARGETSAFLTLLAIGIVSTYLLYNVLGWLVGQFVSKSASLDTSAIPPQV